MKSANASSSSASIRHGSCFRQSNLNIVEVLFITYDLVSNVATNTIQQKHICSVAAHNR
jgi:hypothetical protein